MTSENKQGNIWSKEVAMQHTLEEEVREDLICIKDVREVKKLNTVYAFFL